MSSTRQPERRDPTRAGERERAPSELRVAAILDEASAAGLRPECELLEVASDRWRYELEERVPDLLLVESAWAGTSGSWQYQVAAYDHPDSLGLPNLRALVGWCRDRDVPTVFWGHAHAQEVARFTGAAGLFDSVLTSRPETIPDYASARAGRSEPVDALPLAVQPLIHNPISPVAERAGTPCYAGAYRRDRPAAEVHALEELLDRSRDLGLVIYDPCAGSGDETTELPERFRPHVAGRVPYERTGAAYKSHRVALAGGYPASSRAIPRGVLEAAACGTAVVSAPAAGTGATFGELVTCVEPDRAGDAVSRLIEDGDRRERITVAARRLVLSEHTYRSRLASLAKRAGVRVSPEAGLDVAALVLVDDLEQLGGLWSLVETIAQQSRPPAEVLVGLARETPIDAELSPLERRPETRARVFRQGGSLPRAERYGELAALAHSPWVAPFHPASAYGRHHIADLVGCVQFARADLIGTAIGAEGRRPADRFVDAVHPHSALARRGLVAALGWPDDLTGSLAAVAEAVAQGARCYATAGESFVSPSDPGSGDRSTSGPPRTLGAGA